MAQILASLIKLGWLKSYLDDIIIFGPDFNTLVERLGVLFDFSEERAQLIPEGKFVGHIVSEQGCRPDPANTEAIQNMKFSTNAKEVKRYLSMSSFYRKHLPKFAPSAAPLNNLTSSTVVLRWTDSCRQAFGKFKAKLMEARILIRADVSKPYVVTTDVSDTHVGGVLSQARADGSDRAVGYFSK